MGDNPPLSSGSPYQTRSKASIPVSNTFTALADGPSCPSVVDTPELNNLPTGPPPDLTESMDTAVAPRPPKRPASPDAPGGSPTTSKAKKPTTGASSTTPFSGLDSTLPQTPPLKVRLHTEEPRGPFSKEDLLEIMAQVDSIYGLNREQTTDMSDLGIPLGNLRSFVVDCVSRQADLGFTLPPSLPSTNQHLPRTTPETAEVISAALSSEMPLSNSDFNSLLSLQWNHDSFLRTSLSKRSIAATDLNRLAVLALSDDKDASLLTRLSESLPGRRDLRQILPQHSPLRLNIPPITIPGLPTLPPSSLTISSFPPDGSPFDLYGLLRREVLGGTLSLQNSPPPPAGNAEPPPTGTPKATVSLSLPRNIPSPTARKVLELALAGTPLVSLLHIKGRPGHEGPASPRSSTKARVTVSSTGLTYSEALRSASGTISPLDLGVKIQKVTKLSGNQISLHVSSSSPEALLGFTDSLNKVKNLSASHAVPLPALTPLILRDLQEGTSPDDIANALISFGARKAEILVSDFRKTRAGDSSTTIRISKPLADKLDRVGRLTINWIPCRVGKMVNVPQCHSCLSFDHPSYKCTVSPGATKCVRCGADDHPVKACTAPRACYICPHDATGTPLTHFANSTACPKFLARVKAIRKPPSTSNV